MAASTAPAPATEVPTAPLAPAPSPFPGDPAGATEAAFPNYPEITAPDPAAVAAESTSPSPSPITLKLPVIEA